MINDEKIKKNNEKNTKNIEKTTKNILKDDTHPLYFEYEMSGRGTSKKLLSKIARKTRYINSFIPYSIRLLQTEYERKCEQEVSL